MKCFGGGKEGHLIRSCSEESSSARKSDASKDGRGQNVDGETQKGKKDGEGAKQTDETEGERDVE